jgi:hypothetical protein
MPEATNTVEIARPPADVFAFLADGTNGPKWRSGVVDVEHKSGEGNRAIYTQGVRGPLAALWAIGAVAAGAWWLRGIEVRGMTLEAIAQA